MPQQGYLILAFGPPRYLEMARACAASIRYWDPSREIQLVTDCRTLDGRSEARAFNRIRVLDPPEALPGPMVKLLMHEVSDFEETMFVDADCLMLKGDIDRYWQALAGRDVSCPGDWVSSGRWYDMKIEKMCRLAGVSRLVMLNSGVMFFNRSMNARDFFETAKALYRTHGNFTGHVHRSLGPSDEPYLALAFGRHDIDPSPIVEKGGNAWMVSRLGGTEFSLSAFSGAPYFRKGGHEISPTILHFIGRKPQDAYAALTAAYLETLG